MLKRTVAGICVALACLLVLPAMRSRPVARSRPAALAPEKAQPVGKSIAPYRKLGAWIDMYDKGPWLYPSRAIAEMAERGVNTVYIETANFRKPKKTPLYKPEKLAEMVDAAHEANIKVVAWYLPSFKKLERDLRRALAALDFTTELGNTFDSFALDIESTEVGDIAKRNARFAELAENLRAYAGPNYAMAAIVPDATSTYWPDFPYSTVDEYFDVFMPMGYFTYRVKGERAVRRYTTLNIETIRTATDDPNARIHPIGGIAGDTGRKDVKGFVKAARKGAAIGGSLYDFPITREREWRALEPLKEL